MHFIYKWLKKCRFLAAIEQPVHLLASKRGVSGGAGKKPNADRADDTGDAVDGGDVQRIIDTPPCSRREKIQIQIQIQMSTVSHAGSCVT